MIQSYFLLFNNPSVGDGQKIKWDYPINDLTEIERLIINLIRQDDIKKYTLLVKRMGDNTKLDIQFYDPEFDPEKGYKKKPKLEIVKPK